MGRTTTATVAWQHETVGLRAVWDRVNEPIEWIAAATDAFVTGVADLIDVSEWLHGGRTPWPTDPDAQRNAVASSEVVIEGKVHPGDGYSVWLYGTRPPSPRIHVSAGSTAWGGRLPLHDAGISFDPRYTSTPPREVVDDLVALAVRAWQPLTVNYTTTAVNAEAARSGWDVPVGYRLWISPEVGTFSEIAEGLTTRPLEGGTLLSAPDDWGYLAVAEAMRETLEANDLDEIPHAEGG